MSQPGVCGLKGCVVENVPDIKIRNDATTRLIIKLATRALGSENANLSVRPIPKYFTEFEWLVDYSRLREIALSLLMKLYEEKPYEEKPLTRAETIMYSWLVSGNELRLSFISNHNCLGLNTYGYRLRFVEVTNTKAKEEEFKFRSSVSCKYLYHGSVDQHWYGIIRNGLKNMSETALSYNGASFGHGIYCTNDWRTAMVYCKDTNPRIICAVQTARDPESWERGIGTFVIPDARDLIVRYLILIDSDKINAKL
jgi:hypothetical protein